MFRSRRLHRRRYDNDARATPLALVKTLSIAVLMVRWASSETVSIQEHPGRKYPARGEEPRHDECSVVAQPRSQIVRGERYSQGFWWRSWRSALSGSTGPVFVPAPGGGEARRCLRRSCEPRLVRRARTPGYAPPRRRLSAAPSITFLCRTRPRTSGAPDGRPARPTRTCAQDGLAPGAAPRMVPGPGVLDGVEATPPRARAFAEKRFSIPRAGLPEKARVISVRSSRGREHAHSPSPRGWAPLSPAYQEGRAHPDGLGA